MSYFGRQVVAYIDEGYVKGEWWLRYADRFTPDERKRIRGGDHSAITRPLPPGWKEGDVLKVTPALEIRVGETRLNKRGVYRTVIVQAIDNRGGGQVTQKRLREHLHEITTIVPLKDDHDFGPTYQPEPQRVPNHIVEKLPSTFAAKLRYADQHAKDIERRLRRSLIEDLRRAEFSAVEFEQLRAMVETIRQTREKAA